MKRLAISAMRRQLVASGGHVTDRRERGQHEVRRTLIAARVSLMASDNHSLTQSVIERGERRR